MRHLSERHPTLFVLAVGTMFWTVVFVCGKLGDAF